MINNIELPPAIALPAEHKRSRGLKELAATAICGNDITSSCLYVSALAIIYAGKWAPVVLLMVAAVLYLFRSIYEEVVGALPLNGGAYNALLNTTSKFRASLAACLTILSYMATGVISATEAMHYLQSLWHGLPVINATIILLAVFAGLTIIGIAESAIVAIGIFLLHLASLSLLLLVGIVYLFMHGTGTLMANLASPTPNGVLMALFFGFSAALLGISGFESSANFVEEQEEGVFPKTLRNMWVTVSIFNPTMALLALALLPIGQVHQHESALLSYMGQMAGGKWLSALISVDAVLVLSGAVLTSYVGVNGLVRRMTLDRCLPQFLLKTNRRGTTHRIFILFFALCVSVLLITHGDLKALAGVYTISFLSVMALFGIGNVLLKTMRSRLPRPTRARWSTVIAGIAAVLLGLYGNAIMNPAYLKVFLKYFIPAVLIVFVMLERIEIMRGILYIIRAAILTLRLPLKDLAESIQYRIEEINAQQFVFFTRGHNIAHLNRVMQYVIQNEHTNRIKVVTVVNKPEDIPVRLKQELEILDDAYTEIDVDFEVIEGKFTPELIQELSKRWRIPVNFMFMGSPEGRLIYGLKDLGGVRLII
ncbi:MAG: APC family permease [Candidatus Sumerlaeaceae bacterium]